VTRGQTACESDKPRTADIESQLLALGTRARQSIAAQVVGAPFQQRDFRGTAQSGRNQRQVLREELVLQRTRSRGDQDSRSRQQRGNEICEGFTGSGPGFDSKCFAAVHGRRHPLGHPQLLAADLEVRQRTFQGPAMPKYVRKIKHSRRTLPCVSRPVEASFGARNGRNGARCSIMEQKGAYCPIYEGILHRLAIISGQRMGGPNWPPSAVNGPDEGPTHRWRCFCDGAGAHDTRII
jgi:hypothetical protein